MSYKMVLTQIAPTYFDIYLDTQNALYTR